MELIAYARVSRARDGKTVSVDNQMQQIREWAEAHGHTIVAAYEDRAISATKGVSRPGFDALIRDGRKQIVVWAADRMFRRPVDLEDVVNHGLTIHQVVAGPFDLTTPQGRLMARQMVAFAAYEVDHKNDRVELGMQKKAERGEYLGKHRPFGNNRDGTLVEDEAEAIRKAAKGLIARETSFYQIAKEWLKQGFKTPVNGSRGGNNWTSVSIRAFFISPRLMGYQDYKGKRLKLENWEAILTEREWEQIQSLIESRKTGHKQGYKGKDSRRLLSGLLKCGKCGSGMTSTVRQARYKNEPRENRVVYKCNATGHLQAKATVVEEVVKDDALILLSRRDDSDQEIAQLEKERDDLAHEIRIKEADHQVWREEAIKARFSVSEIRQAQEAHDAEVAVLKADLARLEAQAAPDLFRDNGKGWDTAPTEKKRALLDSLYSSIDIAPAGRGKRFKPEQLTFHYTEYAQEMIKRWVSDNVVRPEELMGRTVGPNVERKSTPGKFDPDDPWEGAEVVNPNSP